jgi:hypothetical protein
LNKPLRQAQPAPKAFQSQKNRLLNLESLDGSFPRWVFGGKNQRNSWQFTEEPKIHKLLNKNNKLNGMQSLLYLASPYYSQSLFLL